MLLVNKFNKIMLPVNKPNKIMLLVNKFNKIMLPVNKPNKIRLLVNKLNKIMLPVNKPGKNSSNVIGNQVDGKIANPKRLTPTQSA